MREYKPKPRKKRISTSTKVRDMKARIITDVRMGKQTTGADADDAVYQILKLIPTLRSATIVVFDNKTSMLMIDGRAVLISRPFAQQRLTNIRDSATRQLYQKCIDAMNTKDISIQDMLKQK
jgi:hypothetical protein